MTRYIVAKRSQPGAVQIGRKNRGAIQRQIQRLQAQTGLPYYLGIRDKQQVLFAGEW